MIGMLSGTWSLSTPDNADTSSIAVMRIDHIDTILSTGAFWKIGIVSENYDLYLFRLEFRRPVRN